MEGFNPRRLADRLRTVSAGLRYPLGYAQALGLRPYQWQLRGVLPLAPENATRRRQKIVICGPNGSGKSSVEIPWATYYWHHRFRRGKVVSTSASQRQLAGQLWPAIDGYRRIFPTYHYRQNPYSFSTPDGGSFVGFSTDDARLAEGYHRGQADDEPLLMIVDEGKSVPDPIFDAIEKCTYDVLLVISSCGRKQGRLWELMQPDRDDIIQIQVGLKDCPHIPQEKIDDIIRTYGLNHPFTRSTLFGEFMHVDDGYNYVFDHDELDALIETPPPEVKGHGAVYACDPGGPAAKCVFTRKLGNRIDILAAWRGPDTNSSTGRYIKEFCKYGCKPEEITIDTDGIGLKFADDLRAAGWDIRRFHGGQPANRSDYYKNQISEAWHETSRMVRDGEIILPDDPEMRAQLTGRRDKWDSNGKRWLESKEEMKARGLPSPDKGDGVCMVATMKNYARPPLNLSGVDILSIMSQGSTRESPHVLLPGSDAGR